MKKILLSVGLAISVITFCSEQGSKLGWGPRNEDYERYSDLADDKKNEEYQQWCDRRLQEQAQYLREKRAREKFSRYSNDQ